MNKTQQALFDKLYKDFPKKKSVGDGMKAFETLNPTELLVDEMIEAHQKQKRAYIAEHGQQRGAGSWKFFKAIGPWLRQQCWLDEVQQVYDKPKSEKVCECGKPATHQSIRGWCCVKCFYKAMKEDPMRDLLRSEWERIGKPRTRDECMETMRRINPLMARLIGRG